MIVLETRCDRSLKRARSTRQFELLVKVTLTDCGVCFTSSFEILGFFGFIEDENFRDFASFVRYGTLAING